MEMTSDTYNDLVVRGTVYCRMLGVCIDHIDDVIGRGFIRVLTLLKAYTPEEQQSRINKLWKMAVYQSVVDEYRMRKREKIGRAHV